MRELTPKKIVLASMFIALGLVLPFLTGQVPVIGRQLLPMHLPVLIGGFVLGGSVGALVGFVTPILRSFIFGMPPFFPTAVAMAFELATYGYLTGAFHGIFPRKRAFIYVNLILSMIGGRLVWGMVSFVLFGITKTAFNWDIFLASAFGAAIPGIILQLILVPLIVISLPGCGYAQRQRAERNIGGWFK